VVCPFLNIVGLNPGSGPVDAGTDVPILSPNYYLGSCPVWVIHGSWIVVWLLAVDSVFKSRIRAEIRTFWVSAIPISARILWHYARREVLIDGKNHRHRGEQIVENLVRDICLPDICLILKINRRRLTWIGSQHVWCPNGQSERSRCLSRDCHSYRDIIKSLALPDALEPKQLRNRQIRQ
jgi:hypothetical protein